MIRRLVNYTAKTDRSYPRIYRSKKLLTQPEEISSMRSLELFTVRLLSPLPMFALYLILAHIKNRTTAKLLSI